jgi:hypothetical protein
MPGLYTVRDILVMLDAHMREYECAARNNLVLTTANQYTREAYIMLCIFSDIAAPSVAVAGDFFTCM